MMHHLLSVFFLDSRLLLLRRKDNACSKEKEIVNRGWYKPSQLSGRAPTMERRARSWMVYFFLLLFHFFDFPHV